MLTYKQIERKNLVLDLLTQLLSGMKVEKIWENITPDVAQQQPYIFDKRGNKIVCRFFDSKLFIGSFNVIFNANTSEETIKHNIGFIKVAVDVINNCFRLIKKNIFLSVDHLMRLIICSYIDPTNNRMLEMLQSVENLTSLTYEMRPVKPIIILPATLDKEVGISIKGTPFSAPINFNKSLRKEKWIHSVVDGRRVALLASKEGAGKLIGLVSIDMLGYGKEDDEGLAAPHLSVVPVQNCLNDKDVAFIIGDRRDLYILFGKQIVFKKYMGRWSYHNYGNAVAIIKSIPGIKDIQARDFLRIALDLSFEGRGALLCILASRKNLQYVTDTSENIISANETLRSALRKKRITDWASRQLISSAAGTDGATIFSKSGELLDIACSISERGINEVNSDILENYKKLEGMRSRAAFRASNYGLSIKVSEDGPICFYNKYNLIGDFY